MSNNFKGLTTSSIKIICPICQNGEEEINLDDWIEQLNELLAQKNEKNENNNKDSNKNIVKYCLIHKDRLVVKYCEECQTDLCEKCLSELHKRFYDDHNLIDINNNKEENIKDKLINENITNNK